MPAYLRGYLRDNAILGGDEDEVGGIGNGLIIKNGLAASDFLSQPVCRRLSAAGDGNDLIASGIQPESEGSAYRAGSDESYLNHFHLPPALIRAIKNLLRHSQRRRHKTTYFRLGRVRSKRA